MGTLNPLSPKTDMASLTSGYYPTVLRHFLLTLSSLLMTFQVTPCHGQMGRTSSYEKFHLCTSSLTGNVKVSSRSSLHCAVMCARRSGCTGYTYDGTCSLYSSDLAPSFCTPVLGPGQHFRKKESSTGIVCQNGGQVVKKDNSLACQCQGGYIGNFCERLMIDCTEGQKSGHYPKMSGKYQALPTKASAPIDVICDVKVQHIIMKRWLGNVTFNVTMDSYVKGFGHPKIDFWIGLESLSWLTKNPFAYMLGIQLNNFTSSTFYHHYYRDFKVKGKDEGYSMTFASDARAAAPATPLGDCLTPLKDIPFSTYDNDNDNNTARNCAAEYGGGWWFGKDCSQCNLVGELRWYSLTRVPGSVSEVFWLPGMEPADFSPSGVVMFLFRS